MRLKHHASERAYSIVEALIACSLTMMLAAGVTKIASVASVVASTASRNLTVPCERPTCSTSTDRIVCACDTQSFTVIP